MRPHRGNDPARLFDMTFITSKPPGTIEWE
jgi:hypothetical protein